MFRCYRYWQWGTKIYSYGWAVGLYKYDFFLIFIILHGLINASIWVDSENIWMGPPAFVKNVRTSSKDWAFCSKNRYLDMRFCDILQHLTTETWQRHQILFFPNGVEQKWSSLIEQSTDVYIASVSWQSFDIHIVILCFCL